MSLSHDTSHLGGRIHPLAKLPTCREHCFAIHYPIPDGWMNPNFDDSKWPRAFEYLDQEVGIVGVPGYWRYPELSHRLAQQHRVVEDEADGPDQRLPMGQRLTRQSNLAIEGS
jgi:hypothetical protein